MAKPPRILVAAGSDSGGGAGLQGDIKTITAMGGYAATAVTALTAQNTLGVAAVLPVPGAFVRQQMDLVITDIGVDAIKTGMLHRAEVIAAIIDVLAGLPAALPLVVDPVMIAKGGHPLLDATAHRLLLTGLMPRATLLTPNIPEAEALTGRTISDPGGMRAAGRQLRAMGAPAVLVKGGHLPGDDLEDWLIGPDGEEVFRGRRIASRNTHGTGCCLASAIATGLGRGESLTDAITAARAYLQRAIATAPGLAKARAR